MLDSVLLNVLLNKKKNKKAQVMSMKLIILRRKFQLIFNANERNGGMTNTTKCAPYEFEVQVTTEKPVTREIRVRRKFPRLREKQTANRVFQKSAVFLMHANFLTEMCGFMYLRLLCRTKVQVREDEKNNCRFHCCRDSCV